MNRLFKSGFAFAKNLKTFNSSNKAFSTIQQSIKLPKNTLRYSFLISFPFNQIITFRNIEKSLAENLVNTAALSRSCVFESFSTFENTLSIFGNIFK